MLYAPGKLVKFIKLFVHSVQKYRPFLYTLCTFFRTNSFLHHCIKDVLRMSQGVKTPKAGTLY